MRPLGPGNAAAVTIYRWVKTDANKITFAICVTDLIDVCDGVDVYDDDETGYTNADGYTRVLR